MVSMDKLQWFNEQHIRALAERDVGDLLGRMDCGRFTADADDYTKRVVHALRTRASYLPDFEAYSTYFFEDPDLGSADAQAFRDRVWADTSHAVLTSLQKKLKTIDTTAWSKDRIDAAISATTAEAQVKPKQLLFPLRYAITGCKVGVGMAETMGILGKDVCMARLGKCLASTQTIAE